MNEVPASRVSDPPALLAAARWVESLLLGNVAVAVAIVAVALIGLSLLAGRIDVRRAGTILLGCFVLFGAPVIAAGLLGAVERNVQPPPTPALYVPPQPLPIPAMKTPYDPYAGASVPQDR